MFQFLKSKKSRKINWILVKSEDSSWLQRIPTFNRQISLNAELGTPSSSSSRRTRFNATISMVSRFRPLKTVPYVPSPIFSSFSYFCILWCPFWNRSTNSSIVYVSWETFTLLVKYFRFLLLSVSLHFISLHIFSVIYWF